MKISFIGAGRVAHHLAIALNHHHEIVQIYSRTLHKSAQLAQKVDAEAIENIDELDSNIDLLILAVSDQSIPKIIEQIHEQLSNVLVVHTSGSTSINSISQYHVNAGVFYPLQTFSLEREIDWKNTPIFIEALHQADQKILDQLANSLSNIVYQYNSKQRLTLHLAAVFACNFSNYCYDMAKQIVDDENVDFGLLYPLILETANKATQHDPKSVQTGPAMRGDQNILNMHQTMLNDEHKTNFKEVYRLLSQQILERHHK